MKMLLKIVGGILVCLALLLVVLRITGLNPHDGIPGLWLTGDLVTTPVTDWSFTDKVPHNQATDPESLSAPALGDNQLRLLQWSALRYFHLSAEDAEKLERNVMRDPHVRIKIGDKLYDRTLVVGDRSGGETGPARGQSEKISQLKTPANASDKRISRNRMIGNLYEDRHHRRQ